MSITIGSKTLATAVPADLDQKMIAATGCSTAEYAQILKGRAYTPFQIARGLAPLLAEPMRVGDLAALISESDVRKARLAVAALLAEPTPAAPAVAVTEDAHGHNA
jgi:hypothetical protein